MIVLRFKSYVNKKSYISCIVLILEPLGSDFRPFFKNLQCRSKIRWPNNNIPLKIWSAKKKSPIGIRIFIAEKSLEALFFTTVRQEVKNCNCPAVGINRMWCLLVQLIQIQFGLIRLFEIDLFLRSNGILLLELINLSQVVLGQMRKAERQLKVIQLPDLFAIDVNTALRQIVVACPCLLVQELYGVCNAINAVGNLLASQTFNESCDRSNELCDQNAFKAWMWLRNRHLRFEWLLGIKVLD